MSTKIPAVYMISNVRSGLRYIGSSINVFSRRRQHFSDLKHNKHGNSFLQADYNEYGKEFFVFQVIETCSENALLEREQWWIDNLHPEYNRNKKVGNVIEDYIRTDDAKKKRKESYHANYVAGKHKKRAYVNPSGPDHPCYGKPISEERRKHLSEVNMGERNPNWGLKRSEETRKKMSEHIARHYDGLISPDGTVYAPITHMTNFCKEHSLGLSSCVAVCRGRKKSHKGWTRYIPEEVKDK